MKILIIQHKMIGDVLITSLLCENIKKAYPNAIVDYLINSNTLPVLENNPYINHKIVFDEKEIPVTLKYMGKETVKAGNLGSKECYKISIGAKTDALKGKDKNLIWLTADAKKVPALIKFSIPVGTGQLALTSASGL